MKHETELNYVKNKIKKLEEDFTSFTSLLIESGIIEVDPENPKEWKVNKING